MRPPLRSGYSPDDRTNARIAAARSRTVSYSRASMSPDSFCFLISAFRLAPVAAWAIPSSRVANHSTSCCSIRSQGGLPITASKPPCGRTFCQWRHTPGKATSQCSKPSRSAMVLASRHSSLNDGQKESFWISSPSSTLSGPCAISLYALFSSSARHPTSGTSDLVRSLIFNLAVSQRTPQSVSSSLQSSEVVASTPLKSRTDALTSATSASDISSICCIPAVACSAC